MHTVLPQNLLERLVYHYTPVYLSAVRPRGDGEGEKEKENARGRTGVRGVGQVDLTVFKSLDYMFYSAAIVAVFQILEVRRFVTIVVVPRESF